MSVNIPLPAAEWSSVYTGEAPEAIKRTVQRVVALVNGIPLVQGDLSTGQAIPDRPRVVSIFGGRGTGKSTLLYFSANTLGQKDDHLVVPIIDPEGFAAGDTLGGWVLAHLDHQLKDHERAFEPECPGNRTLGQMSEDLRRAQAVRSGQYLPGLGIRGLNYDDFARDAVKIPAHGVRMASRVAEFLDGLASARATPNLKVVIPVDDADLFPELLPSIVADAQMLGASARVAVIFAADPKTLTQALQIAFLSDNDNGASLALSSGLMTPHFVKELTGRRLVKHFPRSLRLELPALSPEQRLSFCPLGDRSSDSFANVLRRFPLEDGSGRSLADLFEIRSESGVAMGASPYAYAISPNARELRQLFEAIAHLDGSAPWAAAHALALIMRHGLEGLEADLPAAALRTVRLENARDGGRPIVRFDFDGITLGKGVMGGLPVYLRDEGGGAFDEPEASDGTPRPDPLSSTVTLRPVERHYSRPQRVSTKEGPPEDRSEIPQSPRLAPDDEAEDLPLQYTHLCLLAWEAAQEGQSDRNLFILDSYRSRPSLAGGSNWDGCVVGSPGTAEWPYWRLPAWEEYSDYFTYQAGWARYIVSLQQRRQAPGQNLAPLELALIIHLDLIVSVQASRSVPDWIADLNGDRVDRILRDWGNGDRQLRGQVEAKLNEMFDRLSGTASTVRDQDFVAWFSDEMPLAATPLLTPPESAEWLLALWQGKATVARQLECSARIADMARNHITSYLADGDILLLEAIEPPADDGRRPRAERLRSVRNEFRHRSEQRQHEMIRALEAQEIDPHLIETLTSRGATREVLLGLIQADFKPEDVTAIAEAFPAVREARDESKPSGRPDELPA
jgi:hypothetical protein